MSFRDSLVKHIEEMLTEGLLPDTETVLEMEVPAQQGGPQAGGDEGGPKSAPSATFPWMGSGRPPMFNAPGRTIPPALFSQQNAVYPPASFNSASQGMKEEIIAAVLADLENFQVSE